MTWPGRDRTKARTPFQRGWTPAAGSRSSSVEDQFHAAARRAATVIRSSRQRSSAGLWQSVVADKGLGDFSPDHRAA